jgi:hypothetical protein
LFSASLSDSFDLEFFGEACFCTLTFLTVPVSSNKPASSKLSDTDKKETDMDFLNNLTEVIDQIRVESTQEEMPEWAVYKSKPPKIRRVRKRKPLGQMTQFKVKTALHELQHFLTLLFFLCFLSSGFDLSLGFSSATPSLALSSLSNIVFLSFNIVKPSSSCPTNKPRAGDILIIDLLDIGFVVLRFPLRSSSSPLDIGVPKGFSITVYPISPPPKDNVG